MKLAQTHDGQPIEASIRAPKKAICPHCGACLTLRSRRAMGNGKLTWFWRHEGNKNRDCSARRRPIG